MTTSFRDLGTLATVTAATPDRGGVDRGFYCGVGLFVILLSIVGFGPSIMDPSMRRAALSPLGIAHATLAGTWLLLFLTQAGLVASGRTPIHRRLGIVGGALAAVFIAVSMVTSIEMTRRGYDHSGDLVRAAGGPITPDGILFAFIALGNFGALVAAGLWFRHRPEIHKRLMLLAVVQPLANEPVGHLFGHLIGRWPAIQGWFPIANLAATIALLSIGAIHDRISEGRIHPVSVWVPVFLIVWMDVLYVAVLPSAPWFQFAEWFIR